MRTLLLLSVVAAVAACSDRQPTSPVRALPNPGSGLALASGPTTDGIRVPEAKPTDQVGFTKTFVVLSNVVVLTRGVFETATIAATCPAGSVAVGGGYELYDGAVYGLTDIRIMQSRPTPNVSPTMWSVTGTLTGNTDQKAAFFAVVDCAQ